MSGLVETPFKLTLEETLCSAAVTLCLLKLAKIETPVLSVAELCFTPQYGFTASASSEQCGPRFVRITDIKGGFINWDTVPFCECADPSNYELEAGDIIIARSGSVGKSFLISSQRVEKLQMVDRKKTNYLPNVTQLIVRNVLVTLLKRAYGKILSWRTKTSPYRRFMLLCV
jgi:hypothetical protein